MALVPRIRHVVLDTPQPRLLAEFYRQLFALTYRPGHEPPPDGEPDTQSDWLVLRNADGPNLAFQRSDDTPRATWPDGPFPQMLHLDATVPTREELREQHERALALGATLLRHLSEEDEEIYVYADPSGHPFCLFHAP